MLSLVRPSRDTIESYRSDRLGAVPTYEVATHDVAGSVPDGFHRDSVSVDLGSGPTVFERGRLGIQQWAAHQGSGVDAIPSDAAIQTGTVVALVTRQLGIWVLAACRIVEVVDDADAFGFTYATLPDHPERGVESFTVRRDPSTGRVRFEIEAISQPAAAIVRLGSPVARRLQKSATARYLDSMRAFVAGDHQ